MVLKSFIHAKKYNFFGNTILSALEQYPLKHVVNKIPMIHMQRQ